MTSPTVTQDLARITSSKAVPWQDLEGADILITGANGMLPAYMVETILALNNGAHVFALVRNIERAYQRFIEYPDNKNLTIIVQDIAEPIRFPGHLDYIIHAASTATPKKFATSPAEVVTPNTIGTYNCLELARKKDVEAMLFFSSGEVYGKTAENPLTESSFGTIDPLNIQSCYAESKRMGETLCAAYNKQYQIPTKIVRPFHTYGPGMQLGDGRVFSDFVADVLNNRDIILAGDPQVKRTFCYLSDATIAFFLVLLQGMTREAYNVGGDERFEISVLLLAQILAEKYHLNVIQKKTNELATYQQRTPDISRVRAMGWEPQVSVPEGFRRTVESFKQ